MSKMCTISTDSFDYEAARTGIFQISNALGTDLLDAYIGLTANQKLHTELYVLSSILKDRVFAGNLWELIGERTIEAKQEETLQRHQSVCPHGAGGKHATVERVLLEERKKRCQMEVSLYSQAIELIEQLWLSTAGAPAELDINLIMIPERRMHAPIGCVPVPCTPLAYLIETREVSDAQPVRDDASPVPTAAPVMETLSPLNGPIPSIRSQSALQDGKPMSNLNCTEPLLRLSSTWVTTEVRKAFDEAFKKEVALQADLMAVSLATRRSNALLRNTALDLHILHAKRCRAHTEMALYAVAIENCYGVDTSPPTTLSELLLCKDADMYCMNDEDDLDSEDGTDEGC